MDKATVTMKYGHLLTVNSYLNQTMEKGVKLATIEGLCKLAYNQEEMSSYVEAHAKASQASETYSKFFREQEKCKDDAERKQLEEEYKDAIEQAEKQKEDLAKLLDKEISIDLMKINIDELLIDDYRATRILLPLIEL